MADMKRYVVLAQSEPTARALVAVLNLQDENDLRLGPKLLGDPRCIVWNGPLGKRSEGGISAFEDISRRLREAAYAFDSLVTLNPVTVLVDSISPSELNALSEGHSWQGVISQLILAFPEVLWTFGACSGPSNGFPLIHHSIGSACLQPHRDPLFDPTGLREYVRSRTTLLPGDPKFPERSKTAAAIDEEENYALFHAYAAYRFGYRADAVRSWALMDSLFGRHESHGYDLLFEDVNLSFPDRPQRVHLSDFEVERATACPSLGYKPAPYENSKYRIIVTGGHAGADKDRICRNRKYLCRHKTPSGTAFVLKPVGGVFDLWTKAGLSGGLEGGVAPGFALLSSHGPGAGNAGGHSAPGKLLQVAQDLIRRAEALRVIATTVPEWICGAVLATDALELLRFQTPTLALQALALKHHFEVRAEVAFLGVGYHFELRRRLDELREGVRSATLFFDPAKRRATELDALVSITTQLIMVFRDAGQFDEEQTLLVHTRDLHRQLQLANAPMFKKPLFVPRWYVDKLVGSFPLFVGAIVVWIIAFGVLYSLVGSIPLHQALADSFSSFLSIQPPGDAALWKPEDGWTGIFWLIGFTIVLGFLHLGILVSHLYSKISRR